MKTSEKSAAALLAELKTLSNQAGENMYHRIRIACTMAHDKDWISSIGDAYKANEYLATFFNDINKMWSMNVLFSIYERYPEIEKWRAEKFDLWGMYMILLADDTRKMAAQRIKENEEHKRQKAKECYRERKRKELLSKEERAIEAQRISNMASRQWLEKAVNDLNKWCNSYSAFPELWPAIELVKKACKKLPVINREAVA